MSFSDRLLSCEDDEFVLKVDKDIREFLENSPKNSVLLFPPVNSYRRFLIHKVSESITGNQPKALSTFSIGAGDKRRTVICHRYQLQVDLQTVSLKRSDEEEFTWRYVKRNSVPKHTILDRDMGVGAPCQIEDKSFKQQQTVGNLEADQAVTDGNSSSDDPLISTSKRFLSSRTRRPDRAVYVPRAKRRSQTTPPASSVNNQTDCKSKKSDIVKSKSIDDQHSTSNSDDTSGLPEFSIHPNFEALVTSDSLEDKVLVTNCDQNCSSYGQLPSNEKNQKNLNNFSTMSEQPQVIMIESGGVINAVGEKVDKEEKELIKASQEINRSNRKLIKQTFNSNVLKIEAAGGSNEEINEEKTVNQEEDDWDSLFDDNGDCLDPKMLEELTVAVGKVKIETPKSNYKAYQANVDLLNGEQYPHVLECSNFPAEFQTKDLMLLFSQYKESGFDIKWVDDTHCLVVFSSAKIAADVLTMSHSFVRLKPLKEATVESRTKAKKCSNSLQPFKQRPETCAALAKRLVSGALGVRLKASSEERENERRVLREAKERKLLAAKQREEMWNN